uniref:Uncharacterized protein n=1 Tax=Sphaerodactylus townsendi TaxID=933632 RepID=A0ACB8GG99_9SAUR
MGVSDPARSVPCPAPVMAATRAPKKADPAPPPASPDRVPSAEPEFVAMCCALRVTDSIRAAAWQLYEKVLCTCGIVEGRLKKELWGICIFSTAADLDEMTFTFTELLKCLDISMCKFVLLVEGMEDSMDAISTKVHSILLRLKKKYDILFALYQKFERTWGQICVDQPGDQ